MARIEWIEQRLLNWARWKLASGSGTMARVDLTLADMPRDPYAEVPIPVSDCEASDTDTAVMRLHPGELKITVIEVYIGKGGMRDKARRLCCTEGTIQARIWRAQALLADHFSSRARAARRERERVEALQRSANA